MTLNDIATTSIPAAFATKVTGACVVAAQRVCKDNADDKRLALRHAWAGKVFADPAAAGARMARCLLAHFKTSTASAVFAMSDADIEQAVSHNANANP